MPRCQRFVGNVSYLCDNMTHGARGNSRPDHSGAQGRGQMQNVSNNFKLALVKIECSSLNTDFAQTGADFKVDALEQFLCSSVECYPLVMSCAESNV